MQKQQHLNTSTVEGELTSAPRVTTTASGKTVSNMRIRNRRVRRTHDGSSTRYNYLDITCWEVLAERSRSWKVGDRIIVTGTIQNRTFRSEAGTQNIVEIVADTISHVPAQPAEQQYQRASASL